GCIAMSGAATAAIVTIGNEIVCGDVANTNGSWLAKRLESLGVSVRLVVALRDEIEQIAAFLRGVAPSVDYVVVTGGLGGTPDDPTRGGPAPTLGRGPGGQAPGGAPPGGRGTRGPRDPRR